MTEFFPSENNNDLWNAEAWYTLNNIPENNLGLTQKAPEKAANNALTDAEKAAGWKLLFNGENTEGIRNYRKQTIGSSWKVKDGVLFLDSEKQEGHWQAKDGGDIIITDKPYENYELSLEWKISNCGNSGIIYNVIENETYDYAWLTGPEMQILDNTCHPDARLVTHRAGDLYDLIETRIATVKPAGEWNKIRLVSKNGTIQHWQNGFKVVEYQNNNDDWKEMIKYSKFADFSGFGTSTIGEIVLQDHGDPVFFQNIKIREL
jgi:cytochrome c